MAALSGAKSSEDVGNVVTFLDYIFKMAFDGIELELSEINLTNKAAVFMIAQEMERNETEEKMSNDNVSSNNSLESDDIHNELQMTNDAVSKSEEMDICEEKYLQNPPFYVRSLKSLAAEMLESVSNPVFCTGPANSMIISPYAENQQNVAAMNEDLYLPRSALISTSRGLAAKEHLDNTYESCNEGPCDESAAYRPAYSSDEATAAMSQTIDESQQNIEADSYPANQLYYDSTGLAYTHDGYQFYVEHNQHYYTGENEQTTCILSQCGDMTYVNYVPTNYFVQPQDFYSVANEYIGPAQGYSDSFGGYYQTAQFQPTEDYLQTLPFTTDESTSVDNSQYSPWETTQMDSVREASRNEEWSTNDDSDTSEKANNTEEFVGVYESESGEIILIEPLDNKENATDVYNVETVNDFLPSTVLNGVPVKGDSLMRIDNKNFEEFPSGCPFPSLFVSEDGLITVLLRNGICVEMTLKRDLRLVNHGKKLVAATNDRGSSSVMIHPAIKLVQSGTTTEVDLFLARKAKMKTENITFGNNFRSYKFDYKKIVEEACPMFRNLSEDESVDFLFSSNPKRKEQLVSECIQKSTEAHFDYFSNGGFKVFINGVRVVQNSRGDVYVANGPKLLRMSATSSRLGVQTHFIEASVEANWNVKVKRGTHLLNASHLGFVISNGHIEAAFDDKNRLKVLRLPDRVPIKLGQFRQRRPGVQRRRYRGQESEPEDDGIMTSRYYR